MSNGNGHTPSPLPLAVLGKGAGLVKGDRHLIANDQTPMANMLLDLGAKSGVDIDSFGISTGRLETVALLRELMARK
jgi:hypothetical protein